MFGFLSFLMHFFMLVCYTHVFPYTLGAFYYLLGNCSPRFRSKIRNIQLLLLAKYSTVSEFGIDAMIKPIVEDIQKLESVCIQSV